MAAETYEYTFNAHAGMHEVAETYKYTFSAHAGVHN